MAEDLRRGNIRLPQDARELGEDGPGVGADLCGAEVEQDAVAQRDERAAGLDGGDGLEAGEGPERGNRGQRIGLDRRVASWPAHLGRSACAVDELALTCLLRSEVVG